MADRKRIAKENDDLYRDKPLSERHLHFSLPIPPSINHMYVPNSRGGKTLTRKAKRYVLDARGLINLAIDEQKWKMPSYATWLYADLVFYMPDRRIRDSHNLLKLMLDVMQSVVFENDCFVMPRIQSVEYDKENPRVDVCINPQTPLARERALLING